MFHSTEKQDSSRADFINKVGGDKGGGGGGRGGGGLKSLMKSKAIFKKK